MAKVDLHKADYLKAAEIETEMWRSYYNHQFLRLAWQLLIFMRNVFQCGWILAIRLAWHGGMAAMIYRRHKGHENYLRVLKSLVKFYKIGSDHALAPFDYHKAAQLELEWWDIHRYPKKYDKSLEQSIAKAAGVVYACKPEVLKKYAVYRAEAAEMLTHEGDQHAVKNDWPQIENILQQTWYSFNQAVQPKN
jgi:hypothetical protein